MSLNPSIPKIKIHVWVLGFREFMCVDRVLHKTAKECQGVHAVQLMQQRSFGYR